MKTPPFSLVILYRAHGEQVLNFNSRKERQDHRNAVEQHYGDRIIKMQEIDN